MANATGGIHHVTAICGDPRRNVDFYSGLLGLRLVKKTVNFDDPGSYHLYYGDGIGAPGTILTFFAWTAVPPMAPARGRVGTGQITRTAFAIPSAALEWWVDRLASRAVEFDGPFRRFDEEVIALLDPDGFVVELVTSDRADLPTPWVEGPVPPERAVRRVHGVSIAVPRREASAKLLVDILGLREGRDDGQRFRFLAGSDGEEASVDLLVDPDGNQGRMGIGAIHHVAWRARDRAHQDRLREALVAAGYEVSEVFDRNYFHSIYFREPGGVVFEIATDAPGFTADESREGLGEALKLPPWLEPRRERIEARLPAL
jgi:glyoxalase family protein